MPPVVIDLRKAEDWRDVVHLTVQALVEGKLVAFPTETAYTIAASALREDAVARLAEAKQLPQDRPLTLAIKTSEEILDFVPNLSMLGQRLSRRCWPGPVTLVSEIDGCDSLLSQLPAGALLHIVPNGTVGFRVPAHRFVHDVMWMLAGPLVMSSARLPDEPHPVLAQSVVRSFGEQVNMVLDDGRSRYGQPTTVVHMTDQSFEVTRPGVVSASTLNRLASYIIVFVCTGNTCRSPMAEAICRQLVAERLGCKPQEVADRGVVIESAGVSASMGGRATFEAVGVMSEMGIDLSDHQSQPVTESMIRHADVVFTMTRSHREAILSEWPEAIDRVQLLRHDRSDISDPIGGTVEHYRFCAQQIRMELERWVQEMEI